MRYFEFTLKLKKEDIQSTKIRLKDYSYDSPVEALTCYIFKTLSNGSSFVIYREEASGLKSMYAIDEKIRQPKEALDEILAVIGDVLDKKIRINDPFEITMFDFDTNLREAKRRSLCQCWTKIVDQAGILVYDDRDSIMTGRCGFFLSEKVAGKDAAGDPEDHLFDKSLINELESIRKNKNSKKGSSEEIGVIPAHYVISSRSSEAGSDITAALAKDLSEAGRISSGRMEIFTGIDVDLYRHPGLFEKVIENSYGCILVLDLRGRFATDPASYGLTCSYLAKTICRYKNDNLFVFLYDIEVPGFAYSLLTQIRKSLFLVTLREGKGSREDAEKYLKHLIRDSEVSGYESQAGEFLDTFKQSEFTQTDVIRAFESFESWAVRKNILKSYGLEAEEGFMLDRDGDVISGYEKLKGLIGLKAVKDQIDKVILANKAESQRKMHGGKGRAMHMVFTGNPGTAKTTVAELFAQIAKESGILKSGVIVEKSGLELSGFGSAIRLMQAFDDAMGGVLFIDEAYSLSGEGAFTTLIREMEARRNDVIVIFAGYKDRMKTFLEQNEGLKSRIPYTVDFPDYKPDELLQIFNYILKQEGFTATPGAVSAAREIFGKASRIKDFGNGRYARNIVEKSTLNMSVRLAKKYGDNIPEKMLYKITKDDVLSIDDSFVNINNGENRKGKKEPEKTPYEKLESMIGLESAKKVIEQAVATFKMQKRLGKKGVDIGRNTMHMVFTGNPGTAKTTVARLVAEILKDEGILSSGVFVEAGRADLIGQFVGQTAPKVRKKFEDAMGGVLFIDEAYSLNDGPYHGSYGDEAINTIVQEMDNRRDDIIVIFAGYPDEMKEFIERNPGMSSRIALRVDFGDFSTEELIEITKYQVSEKHLHITDEALDKLVPIYETAKCDRSFGNGRYVRRAVELAISNLALRLDKIPEKDLTDELLMTITAEDISAPALDGSGKSHRKIGFAA